jgi:hypothetical protein
MSKATKHENLQSQKFTELSGKLSLWQTDRETDRETERQTGSDSQQWLCTPVGAVTRSGSMADFKPLNGRHSFVTVHCANSEKEAQYATCSFSLMWNKIS